MIMGNIRFTEGNIRKKLFPAKIAGSHAASGGTSLLVPSLTASVMTVPAAGMLLIADPFLKDPNFMRTVVLLTEHRDDGTIGFVLNRRYENTLDELMPEVAGHKLPVYYGGPVQMNTVHFLHRYPEIIKGSVEVMKGIYWGGDFDAVVSLINSGKADPEKIRFYIGYSGWSAGQLDTEMTEKTWLTVEAVRKLVFHPNAEEIWKDSLKHMGGEYEMMVNFPIDPQLN
jgi:putative transcriptional regulator